MLSPGATFDALVLSAWQAIEERYGEPLDHIEVAVETVPPSDPAPWETRVALGRVFPSQGGLRARVVLYRRPIETRAGAEPHLDSVGEAVHQILAEQVAELLNLDPDDLL